MAITRAQVADLRPGDVVELTFPSGSRIRGPLTDNEYEAQRLKIESTGWTVRNADGYPGPSIREGRATLTVISRAPRQLYVNHPRTDPVLGDVVREESPDEYVGKNSILMRVFDESRREHKWIDRYGIEVLVAGSSPRLRLMIDGGTNEAVR